MVLAGNSGRGCREGVPALRRLHSMVWERTASLLGDATDPGVAQRGNGGESVGRRRRERRRGACM